MSVPTHKQGCTQPSRPGYKTPRQRQVTPPTGGQTALAEQHTQWPERGTGPEGSAGLAHNATLKQDGREP